MFFVGKSDGRQRMVADSRRAKVWFYGPASVGLCSGDTLSALEVVTRIPSGTEPEGDGQIYVAQVYITGAFYRMQLPEKAVTLLCPSAD